ncbi:MAG: YaiI/YqxD family protein [Candidatus Izemoplasmataceae bacterium]
MKIIIDADASPVRKIVVEIAKKYEIELIMVSNINHEIAESYGRVYTVDQGQDSADHLIVSLTNKNDLVVTQDYGLAALVLAKGAQAIHQDGWFFTNDNIDQLLMSRHLNQKLRKVNKRIKPIPKRQKKQDEEFKITLERYLKHYLEI